MARTIEEIQQQMLDEKALQTDLSALNSTSNTAIYKLWIYIQAVIIYYFEVLQDAFKAEVQSIIDNNQYGTRQWWYDTTKAFQYGDLLSFINNVYKYPVVDVTKQIIKYCSITDNGNSIQVKVAKQLIDEPVQLTEDELNGVVDYLQDVRPAGTKVTVQSLSADLVKLNLNVFYNANVGLPNVKINVEAAITNYLTNIQFDGVFYINKLIDAIQAVQGVVDGQVEVLEAAAKGYGDSYVTFTNSFASKSGYFKIDPDFPLSTQINYLT
ncbi:MAG: baseplate J/gp47 family protein [Sphingobacteriales bacterium]|nr:baseplate J/gp47 family protein [Sphingobacteriales bacterium]